MRSKVYLVLLLLSFSLVAAVNVSTDKTDYNSGDIVAVNITDCAGTSIAKFLNPSEELADIKSGESNWSTIYHTSSDDAEGKYTISASCSNGLMEAYFCVDAPGCLEEACLPDWDCGEWSGCGADQMEQRTCTDNQGCLADKEENRTCTACLESWSCSSWSSCQNGIQTRTCFDQNSCGTTLSKPSLQQLCQDLAAPSTSPAPAPAVVEDESFFQQNKGLIVSVIVAAILLVIGLVYLWKWKGKEASFAEVREWISSERGKGVSDETIRGALEKRGWVEKDIKAAFKKLK